MSDPNISHSFASKTKTTQNTYWNEKNNMKKAVSGKQSRHCDESIKTGMHPTETWQRRPCKRRQVIILVYLALKVAEGENKTFDANVEEAIKTLECS